MPAPCDNESKNHTVRWPAPLLTALDSYCLRVGMTRGSVIREATAALLRQAGEWPPPAPEVSRGRR